MEDINSLIQYLEATKPEQWLMDRVRSQDGKKNCVMGHVFDWGGGDEKAENSNATKGGLAWEWFEECWATTYMIYPVNDGRDRRYQQATAKERCIAYLKDLRDGKAKNTRQLWDEYERRPVPTFSAAERGKPRKVV